MCGHELSVGRPCPASVAIAPRLAVGSSVSAGVGGSAALMIGEILGVLPGMNCALTLRARDGDLIDGQATRFQRGAECVDGLIKQVTCHFGRGNEVCVDSSVLDCEFGVERAEIARIHSKSDVATIASERELHGTQRGCLNFALLHGVTNGLGLGEQGLECGSGFRVWWLSDVV